MGCEVQQSGVVQPIHLSMDPLLSCGTLPSLNSVTSFPAICSLSPEEVVLNPTVGVAGPVVPPPAVTAAGFISGSATIQTSQPTSFVGNDAPVDGLSRQRLQRLQQAAKKSSGTSATGTLAPKKTVSKSPSRQARVKSAAAAAAAAAAATEKGPAPGAWTKAEIEQLKQLVEQHGEGNWDKKADAMGSGRTAKALHTRWLRESGRIIDMPRGQNNLLNHELTSTEVHKQQAILDQAGYLLPMLTGSLAATFGYDAVVPAKK
jgi:hypothetical protein